MNLTTNATINLRLSFDDRGDIAVVAIITNTIKLLSIMTNEEIIKNMELQTRLQEHNDMKKLIEKHIHTLLPLLSEGVKTVPNDSYTIGFKEAGYGFNGENRIWICSGIRGITNPYEEIMITKSNVNYVVKVITKYFKEKPFSYDLFKSIINKLNKVYKFI